VSHGRVDSAALRALIRQGGEFALIDVREERPFGAGHILTACHAPLSRLELRIAALVPRLSTRLVVTDGGEGLAERAAGVLATLGYGEVAVHDGGAPAWAAAGYELFWGTNVPSKAFGEILELACHTPALDAGEVRRRVVEGQSIAILDSRPWDEYLAFHIPGGIDCPGAELAYRVRDLVPDPATTIVVNCAGRTRSILGTQSLVNAGVPNPVFALRNGTIGWEWAGQKLAHGQGPRCGPVSEDACVWSRGQMDKLAQRAGVTTIDPATLKRWRADPDVTLYVFDVRTAEEFATGTLEGAISIPGGQLVQETDAWIGVRDARIVLVDDTGVRARMSASWLAQMGHGGVAVLDVDVRDHAVPPPGRRPHGAPAIAPQAAHEGGHAMLDLSSWHGFHREHPAGAVWGLRARLGDAVALMPADRPVAVLDDEDGHLAALALADLARLGRNGACVLEGGLVAWKAEGLPTDAGGQDMPNARQDACHLPWELEDDPGAAMRAYIDWELQLPEQFARDGLLTFAPLVSEA